MPAKSKSQQRLFGAVHAYNNGEFRGSPAFRKRVAALARRISDEDARHFAETPHEGLPEKKAQVMLRPEQVRELYSRIPPSAYATVVNSIGVPADTDGYGPRSRRRRSFLGRVMSGTAIGTAVGGLGAGALGAYIARSVASGAGVSPDEMRGRMLDGGLRLGLWGAGQGAAAGAAVGAGLGLVDKLRG